MIRKNPSGHLPQIHQSAYIDQTAIICGKVIIHANVFVGPYAVIRADENGDMEPIVIGANSNIQDGVVIHSKAGAGPLFSIKVFSIASPPPSYRDKSRGKISSCISIAEVMHLK